MLQEKEVRNLRSGSRVPEPVVHVLCLRGRRLRMPASSREWLATRCCERNIKTTLRERESRKEGYKNERTQTETATERLPSRPVRRLFSPLLVLVNHHIYPCAKKCSAERPWNCHYAFFTLRLLQILTGYFPGKGLLISPQITI